MTFTKMAETQLVQYILYALLDLFSRDFTQLERIGHVFKHGFVRPQGVGLEHQPQVTLLRRNLAARRTVVNFILTNDNRPLGRFFQTRDGAQQGGFAAAGRAQQGDHFAAFQVHGDPF